MGTPRQKEPNPILAAAVGDDPAAAARLVMDSENSARDVLTVNKVQLAGQQLGTDGLLGGEARNPIARLAKLNQYTTRLGWIGSCERYVS